MRLRAINRELKYFDRELRAVKSDRENLIQVYRRAVSWERYDFGSYSFSYSRPTFHRVLALTDNWSPSGTPVEWGIEPLLGRLREIDGYNQNVLARIWEENETKERLRKRAHSNELKAIAYDVRRDFARAVNDVNTSTLEKIELRRKKDAYRSKRP